MEARSLRSHPRFLGHCRILATGFQRVRIEIIQLIHLLEVFEKSCRHPKNILKTQPHLGCTNETRVEWRCGRIWGLSQSSGRQNICVASHRMSFLFHHPKAAYPEATFSCLAFTFPFSEAGAEVLSTLGSLDSRRPSGNEHLLTLLLLPNRGKAAHRIRKCPRAQGFHHEKSDLRPESEGWDFLLWTVFSPGWVSNVLSQSPHLSTRHFHQMTQRVPSQLPYTSDSGVCSQAF